MESVLSKFGNVRITDEDGNEVAQVVGGALLVTGNLGGDSASESTGEDGGDLLIEIKKLRRLLEIALDTEIKVEDL